ncbi:Zds1 protein [Martiniozyma asiatica (nom. inval.)]|nr:Zds1 protein [Martiniozyma asiatica]
MSKSPSPTKSIHMDIQAASKAVEQEYQAVKRLKRLSMGNPLNFDPDLPPSENELEEIIQLDQQLLDSSDPFDLDAANQIDNIHTTSLDSQFLSNDLNSINQDEANNNNNNNDDDDDNYDDYLDYDDDGGHIDFVDIDHDSSFTENDIWVPANAHPKLSPENFRKHVEQQVLDIQNKSRLQRSGSVKSSLGKERKIDDDDEQEKSGDNSKDQHGSQIHHSVKSRSKTPDALTGAPTGIDEHGSLSTSPNKWQRNPSLRELTEQLENLSQKAGLDKDDAASLARSLSTKSIGVTRIEHQAFHGEPILRRTNALQNNNIKVRNSLVMTDNEDLGETSDVKGRTEKISPKKSHVHVYKDIQKIHNVVTNARPLGKPQLETSKARVPSAPTSKLPDVPSASHQQLKIKEHSQERRHYQNQYPSKKHQQQHYGQHAYNPQRQGSDMSYTNTQSSKVQPMPRNSRNRLQNSNQPPQSQPPSQNYLPNRMRNIHHSNGQMQMRPNPNHRPQHRHPQQGFSPQQKYVESFQQNQTQQPNQYMPRGYTGNHQPHVQNHAHTPAHHEQKQVRMGQPMPKQRSTPQKLRVSTANIANKYRSAPSSPVGPAIPLSPSGVESNKKLSANDSKPENMAVTLPSSSPVTTKNDSQVESSSPVSATSPVIFSKESAKEIEYNDSNQLTIPEVSAKNKKQKPRKSSFTSFFKMGRNKPRANSDSIQEKAKIKNDENPNSEIVDTANKSLPGSEVESKSRKEKDSTNNIKSFFSGKSKSKKETKEEVTSPSISSFVLRKKSSMESLRSLGKRKDDKKREEKVNEDDVKTEQKSVSKIAVKNNSDKDNENLVDEKNVVNATMVRNTTKEPINLTINTNSTNSTPAQHSKLHPSRDQPVNAYPLSPSAQAKFFHDSSDDSSVEDGKNDDGDDDEDEEDDDDDDENDDDDDDDEDEENYYKKDEIEKSVDNTMDDNASEETVDSGDQDKLMSDTKNSETPPETPEQTSDKNEDPNMLLLKQTLKEAIESQRNFKPNQPLEMKDSAFGFPLPPVSQSTLVMLDYRLPVHVERAIYRLSHLKLADSKRPLGQQVLLSNFMYAYLNLVNHTLWLQSQNADEQLAE